MNKQEIQFAVAKRENVVVSIGRSWILQPKIRYKEKKIKWHDDPILTKEQNSSQTATKNR